MDDDDDLFSFAVEIICKVTVTLCVAFWCGVLIFLGYALG